MKVVHGNCDFGQTGITWRRDGQFLNGVSAEFALLWLICDWALAFGCVKVRMNDRHSGY